MTRIYEGAWARVRDKRPNVVVLLVHPLEEFTVRRMIRKEKNDDLVFKLLCADKREYWRLIFSKEKKSDTEVRLKINMITYVPLLRNL